MPAITTIILENVSPGPTALKAKQEQMKKQVEEKKAFSELTRQMYKPKISKKKISQMAELKAKTTANKPKQIEFDRSASEQKTPQRKILGNDYLSNMRKVRQESELLEDFGL